MSIVACPGNNSLKLPLQSVHYWFSGITDNENEPAGNAEGKNGVTKQKLVFYIE